MLKWFVTMAVFSASALISAPALADGEILLTQAKALAGNVTPGDPPGYPIVLTLPGIYQFAGNVHPPANTVGIQIGSPNVTIDLNGFQLHGSTVALFGIAGSADGTTIRNGTITGFKFDGIHVLGGFLSVENIRAVSNGRDGIRGGDNARISDSIASDNGRDGVSCSTSCLAERNIATENDSSGIACGLGCYAEGNLASFNDLYGIFLQDGFALGNTVSRNVDFGITGTPSAPTAYGNNTLTGNNVGGVQAANVFSLHANYCFPGACP